MSVDDARMFVFAQGDELLDINGSLVDGDGDYAGIMSVIGHLDEDYELARYTARENHSEVVEMVRKPKPVALLEYLIKTYTNENETVLDNTMDSGSTGVACINAHRNFIGRELDEKYFNKAKQRIGEIVKLGANK